MSYHPQLPDDWVTHQRILLPEVQQLSCSMLESGRKLQKHEPAWYLWENREFDLLSSVISVQIKMIKKKKRCWFVLVPGLHSRVVTSHSEVSLGSITTGLKVRISVKVWPRKKKEEHSRTVINKTARIVFLLSPPASVLPLISASAPPLLRPYVSTGSASGPSCPPSGRTAPLPSPPPDLCSPWSKASWAPRRRSPCSPDPATTCAAARTRLTKECEQGVRSQFDCQTETDGIKKKPERVVPCGLAVENTLQRSFFSIFGRLSM